MSWAGMVSAGVNAGLGIGVIFIYGLWHPGMLHLIVAILIYHMDKDMEALGRMQHNAISCQIKAIKLQAEYMLLISEARKCHKSPRSTSEEGGLSADHPRKPSPNSVNASTATAGDPSVSEPGR